MEEVNLVSSFLDGGDASLLLRQGDKFRMGHEAMDGATGLWALQPLIQGATERVHHLNLKQKRKEMSGRAEQQTQTSFL